MRSDSREATCRVCDGRGCCIRSVFTLPVPPCAHTELRAGEMTEGGGLAMFTLISSFTSLHLCWSVGVRLCVRIIHSSIRSFSLLRALLHARNYAESWAYSGTRGKGLCSSGELVTSEAV